MAPSDRPLRGRTVVVTRPRRSAGALVDGLESLGAEVIICPAIRIEYLDLDGLRAQVPDPAAFRWIIFTSANAVGSIASLLAGAGSARIAAIGTATARAVEELGLAVSFQPSVGTGERLGEEMGTRLSPGDRVLLPQSDLADNTLGEALARHGALVRAVTSYRTVSEGPEAGARLRAYLEERVPDVVLFASPSSVRGLEKVLGDREYRRLMRGAALVSIGPATTRRIASLGFPVAREADPHSVEGLIAAVRHLLRT